MASKKEKKKAERVEKLRKSIDSLRSKVLKDLKKSPTSKDFQISLAIALIDATYARVGNKKAEEENGHFGVTGWRKEHISFKGGKATISYTGKSGVKQKKTVDETQVVKALKKLYDKTDKPSDPIFQYDYQEDLARLNARDVNEYLGAFGVTAKDIRGFHANSEMRDALEDLGKERGDLPEDPKEREKVLKADFDKALESVAKCLGHQPSTLRNQYLVEGFEEHFFKEGKPLTKFDKHARIARRVAAKIFAHRSRG